MSGRVFVWLFVWQALQYEGWQVCGRLRVRLPVSHSKGELRLRPGLHHSAEL